MLQTATNDPAKLADAVGFSLSRDKSVIWRSRRRCDRIARTVTPLVLDSMREHRGYRVWDEAGELYSVKATFGRLATNRVRAGLGIFQYLLWQWILPKIIEWIVEWYFSDFGYAMRAKHRAEAEE